MTPEEAIGAFKPLAETDILAEMLLNRDPVYQLTQLTDFLKRIENWIVKSEREVTAGASADFQGLLSRMREITSTQLPRAEKCLVNAIKARDATAGGVIKPSSFDDDPAATCIERQQEINRETLESLSEADTLSERIDAIQEWGEDTKENLGECIDNAFGQFDEQNP